MSLPLVWANLDLVASHVAAGGDEVYFGIAVLIEGLVLWLLCIPLFADWCIFFACRYCQRGSSTVLEVWENLKLELIAAALLGAMVGTWILICGARLANEWHERPLAVGVFAGVWGIVALIHLVYTASRKRRPFDPDHRR